MATLKIETGAVAFITLNRPEVRAIVLAAEVPAICAGAD
jgi:enoyl-CoA hydratase/carnithine racemase